MKSWIVIVVTALLLCQASVPAYATGVKWWISDMVAYGTKYCARSGSRLNVLSFNINSYYADYTFRGAGCGAKSSLTVSQVQFAVGKCRQKHYGKATIPVTVTSGGAIIC